MKKGWIALVAAVGVVAVLALAVAASYNGLVTADEAVSAAWADVEKSLQRRADLIPNLVNTVKGYAKQETTIFTQIADARARMAGAGTIPEKISANQQMESALARLLVVVERYPELKSNQNFIALQDELAGTENRLAVDRRRYNESVQLYNLRVRRFPSNIAAAVFGFARSHKYFEAADTAKTVPTVQF